MCFGNGCASFSASTVRMLEMPTEVIFMYWHIDGSETESATYVCRRRRRWWDRLTHSEERSTRSMYLVPHVALSNDNLFFIFSILCFLREKDNLNNVTRAQCILCTDVRTTAVLCAHTHTIQQSSGTNGVRMKTWMWNNENVIFSQIYLLNKLSFRGVRIRPSHTAPNLIFVFPIVFTMHNHMTMAPGSEFAYDSMWFSYCYYCIVVQCRRQTITVNYNN